MTRLNIEWLRSEAKASNRAGDVAKAVRLAEAADEIERLRTDVQTLTKQRDHYMWKIIPGYPHPEVSDE